MTDALSDRYGTPRRWQRPATIVLSVVVAVVFLGWLAWVAWFHGSPEVESDLQTYDFVSEHEVTAVVTVSLADGVEADCRIRALAADHSVVGEDSFTPVDGRNEVSLRTERAATSVELVGCTSEDQPRPQ